MSLPQFLHLLLYGGRVAVDPVLDQAGRRVVVCEREQNDALAVLDAFEQEYRQGLPFQPPSVDRDALLRGALAVRSAASLLTYRDANAEQVQLILAGDGPDDQSASSVYSVDLTLRFLPDLVRLARAASPGDPLVGMLLAWASRWPLSSVGIKDLVVSGPCDWLDDPCLRQLYADRILAEQDLTRLTEPRACDAVRESLGRHLELAPKVAASLMAK